MNIKLNKDKFTAIDGAFLVLKENPSSDAAIKIIKTSLEDCFNGCEFDVKVINEVNQPNSPLFVMCVYPELSVVDKVIEAVMNEKENGSIKKLWETNKKWTLEIDSKILDNSVINCTEKELTSILLHEVGHIVCSTSIPNRISLVLRYEIIRTKMSNKMMLKDKIFRKILSLPVLDACISDGKRDKSSIKEEVKADAFAKKMGYQNELMSVLTKFMNNSRYANNSTQNDKISKLANFSLKTLEDFQARKDKLAKNGLLSLKEDCCSPYIESVISDIIETMFEDSEDSLSIINGRKLQYMQERADKDIENGYYTEFFIFGGKQLKRIDPYDLDYIDVKISGIKNESDKLMVVSYIHSKMDLVDYYISILENPKTAKKYIIPNSLKQLYDMKKRLLVLRDIAVRFKIPERNKSVLVAWPSGYEG